MSSATTFLIAFSAVFGTAEAIRHTQGQARKKEHRSRKNNLIVHCPKSSPWSASLEGRAIVLAGDQLYIDTDTNPHQPFGHPFAGYYLPYPDTNHMGLVSTICDEPPIMNWVYIDKDTHAVKYGIRASAQPNLTGPFDCTRQDHRLTFAGWEGFCAVWVTAEGGSKSGDDGGCDGDVRASASTTGSLAPGFTAGANGQGRWALYFDVHGNGLRDKVPQGTPVLEVLLSRVEMRLRPDIAGDEDEDAESSGHCDCPTGPGEPGKDRNAMPGATATPSTPTSGISALDLGSPDVD